MKSFLKILMISALGGIMTLGSYILFFEKQEIPLEVSETNSSFAIQQIIRTSLLRLRKKPILQPLQKIRSML